MDSLTIPPVRLATLEDWKFIQAWRTTHHLEISAREGRALCVTGQKGFDDAVWLVAPEHGRPCAAVSYIDNDIARVRRIYDLYWTPGRMGLRYGLMLGALMEDCADALGYDLRCNTDPENSGFLKVLSNRGYEIVAIELKREARHGRNE